MKLIGIHHTVRHPSYADILGWIQKNVQQQHTVALECPYTIEELIASPTATEPTHQFFQEIGTLLHTKGSPTFSVDEPRFRHYLELIRVWYWFDDKNIAYNNPGYKLAAVKRSIALLQAVTPHIPDFFFLGNAHAHHLQELGYTKGVLFLPELSPTEKQYDDGCLEVYRHYLAKKEQHCNH